jgi:hypothetical protein
MKARGLLGIVGPAPSLHPVHAIRADATRLAKAAVRYLSHHPIFTLFTESLIE